MTEPTFKITITGIKTADYPGFPQTVKQVEWILHGTLDSLVYSLPGTTELPSPENDQNFVPFENLTEAEVVSWIEANDLRLPYFKQNVTTQLQQEYSRQQLKPAPLPWMPPPPSPATTTDNT